MAKKYYVVKVGRTPGIYFNWEDCKRMVEGYPKPVYRGFETLSEAEAFLAGSIPRENSISGKATGNSASSDAMGIAEGKIAESGMQESLPETYAFVDGSFCEPTGIYGYGGFLIVKGEKYILQGSGHEEDMTAMRNVAGEILGSMAAVEKALELGVKELTIFYDYTGIEMWATGSWKRNKAGTIAYYEYMQSVKNQINISFVKVKGHSGIEGNEEADRLAKEAVGIE